ncbi:MAG TPA: type II toxin-antitoxin system prevent-host-death family antitoxin [Nakamurella sp.]
MGIRELRQNASELLDRVAAGHSIEITNHGRAVARLVPAAHGNGRTYAEHIADGTLRPGRGDVLDVLPIDRPTGVPGTDELLALDRDQSR